MKMTKNWKRFWTLDRHHAEGFTLVELIVVIAILAILAGVAVPAYSGYITEANKTADRQLVRDIEQALMMGYYQGVIKDGGIVTLDQTGNFIQSMPAASEDHDGTAAAAAIRAAMENAFGANSQELALKGDWKGNVGEVYAKFKDSSFSGREKQLLGDVQQLTDSLAEFFQDNGTEFLGSSFSDFANKNGINTSNPKEAANAGSLYVAELTKGVDVTEFVKAWTRTSGQSADLAVANFQTEKVGLNLMGSMAAHYARAESLADFVDDPANGITATFTQWLASQSVYGGSSESVSQNMVNITNAFAACLGADYQADIQKYGASAKAKEDAEAYVAMMGAINDNSDKIKGDLQKDNLYSDGNVEQMLKDYMAAGQALGGINAVEGQVAIVISITENGCSTLIVGMNEE